MNIDLSTIAQLAEAQKADFLGKKMKTFNWILAVKIIKERNPKSVIAGLLGDYGMDINIWEDGEPIKYNGNVYLTSKWAIPYLSLDEGEEIECWVYLDEHPEWDYIAWPKEALDIVEK